MQVQFAQLVVPPGANSTKLSLAHVAPSLDLYDNIVGTSLFYLSVFVSLTNTILLRIISFRRNARIKERLIFCKTNILYFLES